MDNNWKVLAHQNQKKYRSWLKRVKPKKVYDVQKNIHDEIVEKINCLTCAECCKNYSPRFKAPDIKRIARHLKMKESIFIDTYLNLDEDNDFVMKTQPCSFLQENNACSIYEVRPSDCSRFPYTDEDVLVKRPNITIKNSSFCPIVYNVLEKLIEKVKT